MTTVLSENAPPDITKIKALPISRPILAFGETVLNTMGEGLYTLDTQGCVTFMNAAAEKLCGWTLDELHGRTMHDVMHHTRRDGTPFPASECAALQVLAAGQTLTNYEDVFIRKDGTFFDVVYSSAPLRENGTLTGLVVVFRDVTPQKQATLTLQRTAETLHRTQARLESALAAGLAGTFYWDVGQGRVITDENMTHYFGLASNALTEGVTFAEILPALHPDDVPQIMDALAVAFEKTGTYQMEHRVNHPDGKTRWLSARGLVERDAYGQAIGMYGFVVDITRNKEAEAQLRASEERYRTLFESIDEGFCVVEMIWDAQGQALDYRFLETNAAFERYTGLKESHDRTARELLPELDIFWIEMYGRVAQTGVAVRFEHHAQATQRWFEIHASRVKDATNRKVAIVFNDITERKQSEERIRVSEERFRTLADNISQLAWMADATGWIFWYNQRWYDYTGTTLDAMQGWGWQAVHHPDYVAPVTAHFKESVAAGQEWEDTFPLRAKDGTYSWFLSRALPIRDAQGQIVRWFGTNTDITERRRAEENERERNRQLDLLARTSQHLILHPQPDETLLQEVFEDVSVVLGTEFFFNFLVTDADERKLRLVSSGGLNQKQKDFFANIEFGQFLCGQVAACRKRILAENLQLCEWPEANALKSAGVTCYGGFPLIAHERLIGTVAFAAQGRTHFRAGEVQMIQTVCDQVAATLERARLFRELSASSESLRLALESGEMGVWRWDVYSPLHTPQIKVDERFLRIYDISREELERDTNILRKRMHPDDVERIETIISQALAKHTPYQAEFRIIHANGAVRWLAGFGRANYDADGQPQEMNGVNFDITARKQAEEERERLLAREKLAREQAETANRLKDEFLATVSHELRTPLNAILGWTSIALDRRSPPAMVSHALEVIARNGRSQNQLISDMLDVSRIVMGKLSFEPTELTLSVPILAAVDAMRLTLEAKGVNLLIDLDESLQVWGDDRRVQQIVWNLLSNAAKFTPAGGTVELTLAAHDQAAQIVVRDTGEGIAPEFLPYVFDRFRQANGAANRQHGGLGLGLAIVRHLAEMHQGTAHAASAGLGHGATFTVRLPLR